MNVDRSARQKCSTSVTSIDENRTQRPETKRHLLAVLQLSASLVEVRTVAAAASLQSQREHAHAEIGGGALEEAATEHESTSATVHQRTKIQRARVYGDIDILCRGKHKSC